MNKKLINVSDIVSYLYCPRKLYLTKIKRIPSPQTPEMIKGRLKHEILEDFSRKEKEFVSSIDRDYEKLDLVFMYENLLTAIAQEVLDWNKNLLNSFRINSEEILKKTIKDFTEDIKIRVEAIKEKLKENLFGEELWKNLDKIYLSEIPLESENLGLKGRVDRIMISKKDNTITPFELKSREGQIYQSDELQLTAYAMLLEERYKTKIEKGIVEASSLKKEIIITKENRELVLEILDEIKALKEDFPPMMLSNFNKCKSCSLNEICPNI